MMIRAIHVKMHVYFSPSDTPATKNEISNARNFITAVEDAAKKYLPRNRSVVKIKEERDCEVR